MASPFAAHEARINAAVVKHLSNATADFWFGITVDGIFDNAYLDALGFSGATPVFNCISSAVVSAAQGDAVVISGVNYTISRIEPDGVGMTRLVLQED